jgi:hypothetical protein
MDLTDEELNAYILTRLALAGVDLSVLPEENASAPVDRRRVLASARRFLRTAVPAIRSYPLDPDTAPPVLYAAALAHRLREAR